MAIPAALRSEVMLAVFAKHNTFINPLEKYFTVKGNPDEGTMIKYGIKDFGQGMTPQVPYGGRAPVGNMPTRQTVTYEPPTYKEKIALPPQLLKHVVDFGTLTASQEAQVSDAIAQTRLNMERRWAWLQAQWMTGGALLSSAGVAPIEPSGTVYLDNRFSKTASPQSISLGFTPAHIDAGVTASWATAATNIKKDLDIARRAIRKASGIDATRVIGSSLLRDYIEACTGSGTRSEAKREQFDLTGEYASLWGYTFDFIDTMVPFDALSMATDTGATGMVNMIPDNVVILTTENNLLAGRYMVGCQPSDALAPPGHRGVYAWRDEEKEHPHTPSWGIEYTGGPILINPDSTYIYTKNTDTS
jgi:hypothetical protein